MIRAIARQLPSPSTLARLILPAVLAAACAAPALAQPRSGRSQPATLRVYLDCNECDETYLRQTVGFVDYVRDRNVADVHVLVLVDPAGGGGRVWTLLFIGYAGFRGQNRTFELVTPASATQDDQRREFARVFRLGLVGYTAGLAVMDDLDVTWRQPENAAAVQDDRDAWNHWVFRLDAGGDLSGEQQSRFESYRYAASASRVTANWKFNLSGTSSTDRSTFEFDDDAPLESERESWSADALLVKSLGAHWSAGTRLSMARSSYSNTDRSASVEGGLEVDAFPYSQSSRRSVTLQYTVGAIRNEYRDVTIFDKVEEIVPNHTLNLSAGFRQPWGALMAQSTFTQQLDRRERYRVSFEGNTDVHLFSGFSLSLFGEYSRIRDQISLPKDGASRDEVLLRLQQLATDHSYFVGVGISYSFGSIFNSVVNPRFGRPR
jgi:hypothetical protein